MRGGGCDLDKRALSLRTKLSEWFGLLRHG